jgi:hypothetical protein
MEVVLKICLTSPRIKILISFFDHTSEDSHETLLPILLSGPSTRQLTALVPLSNPDLSFQK